MKFTLTDDNQLNPLLFGMSRDSVRKSLNSPFEAFSKDNTWLDTDSFAELGLFAYYHKDESLEAVELAHNGSALFFKGQNLFLLSYQQAKSFFEKAGFTVTLTKERVTVISLNLCMWFPRRPENPACTSESILVGETGYYEK